jgi:phosphatidylserine synthase
LAYTVFARAAAWSVHIFTSLGLVAAAGIAVLLVRGGDDCFRAAFALMWLATIIDAVDGALAAWRECARCSPISTAAVSTTSSIFRPTPAFHCC